MTPSDDRAARSLSFGAVAEAYERYRPGYPVELVDLVLARSDSPVRSAVEIGAGTGKATREFAARGVAVTALEPDPQMCALLERASAGLPVSVVQSTFESWAPPEPVDLVYAAASWHWTDPATRYERAARYLRPGGTLACFRGGTDLVDERLADVLTDLRDEVVPPEASAVRPASPDLGALGWPGHELVDSPWFTEVSEHPLPHEREMDADDYIGLLSTISAYAVLPDAVRDNLLDRIRAALPDLVLVRRDLVLHLATRA